MLNNKCTKLVTAIGFALFAGTAQAAVMDVVTNGGFETGNLDGWLAFPSLSGTVSVANQNSPLGPAGSYSGNLYADGSGGASFPALKVERLAEGLLTGGSTVTVSYDAYAPIQTVDINAGENVGAVVFIAEFFTERTGDNGAVNNILQGAPNWLTTEWQHYEYTFNLAEDAGGGASMLFKADCGANANCRFDAYIDNLSIVTDVNAVPVPAAAWLFGSGLLGLIGIARRKKIS